MAIQNQNHVSHTGRVYGIKGAALAADPGGYNSVAERSSTHSIFQWERQLLYVCVRQGSKATVRPNTRPDCLTGAGAIQ